jgi:putative ABC transport system permease protein
LKRLNRKLIRDLGTHWAQVVAIIVVVAFGVIMFSGPLLAQRGLKESIDAIYRRTRYEDFSVKVDSAPPEAVDQLEAQPNIRAAEGRLVRDLQGTVKGSKLNLRVITVPDTGRPSVNDLIVEDGRYLEPGGSNQVLIDHHLATEFGLKPGGTVILQTDGAEVPLRVTGSVVSPEYLRLVRSRSEYVSDPAQFGVVFMKYSDAVQLLGTGGGFNDVVVRVKYQGALDETMERARVLFRPYNATGLTSGNEEPGAVSMDLEIKDIGRLAVFFAVLLLAVAALALYITMTRIVFSQQREIGVTRALGYNRRTVTVHYLGYGAVLGITGGVLGVVAGYLLSRLFISIYADVFALPFMRTSLQAWIMLAGLAAGVVFSIAGAFVPARHSVRMKPADAMRTEAGLSLAHLPHPRRRENRRGQGLPAWLRISFRNLLRNRRRTLLTCLGVIGTLCLLITATGSMDSLNYSVEKYLNGVLRWDVAAVWQSPVGADTLRQIKALDGVVSAEPLIDAPALLVLDHQSIDIQVQAFKGDTALHGSYPTPGSKASPGPGEVVLNRGIRSKLPVKVGDRVTLSTPLGSLPFQVAGFVSEPLGGICYVNLEYTQGLIKATTGVPDAFNAVVVKAEPGSTESITESLRDLPGVSQVLTKAGITEVLNELIAAIRNLLIIFYVMAFAMGFATLFSMTTVNLLERGREVATMRTLGAGRTRIFSFITVETAVVVLLALVPGVILGRLLQLFLVERLMSSDRLVPDAVLSGGTVAIVIAASIAVMVLSELPSIRRLWRMDLAGATKERAD